MVVGIDVYHDTAPGGRRSVAGIIASTNANFTKYYSRVTIQSQVRTPPLLAVSNATELTSSCVFLFANAARTRDHRWTWTVHGRRPQALLQGQQLPA
jgi:hypothetical protein